MAHTVGRIPHPSLCGLLRLPQPGVPTPFSERDPGVPRIIAVHSNSSYVKVVCSDYVRVCLNRMSTPVDFEPDATPPALTDTTRQNLMPVSAFNRPAVVLYAAHALWLLFLTECTPRPVLSELSNPSIYPVQTRPNATRLPPTSVIHIYLNSTFNPRV